MVANIADLHLFGDSTDYQELNGDQTMRSLARRMPTVFSAPE